MADINQVITWGIGTPSDIEHFILVGLNCAIIGTKTLTLVNRSVAYTLEDRTVAKTLFRRSQSMTLEST